MEREEKISKIFSDPFKNHVIIEGSAKRDGESDLSGCDELGGEGKGKIFKKFFRSSKKRVIVEGFADRSKQDARQRMSSVVIVKNIQPISVGV